MKTKSDIPIPSLRQIYLHALAQASPEARAAYLNKACGHDQKLRSKVEELLRQTVNDGFLETPAAHLEETEDLPLSEGTGSVIDPRDELRAGPCGGLMAGRYKLLQKIGEGGFGVVYMAEQQEPVVRRVALKIIKPGMDSRQVIARFEAERQALAMMDHPHVAKVLDAGAIPELRDRPFFVMELVHGIRITKFCDENDLTMPERLELFLGVCSAIQHAHQKGIIHRDIKPSNVLVTMHDDKPVPKVIDFGIAKAIEQRLTDKTLFTNYAQFVGTPAYVSPEQAQMSGLDIDTRSDIYSLGVLLYELITGRTPLDGRELIQSGIDEIRRRIREEEPAKPSTRLSTLTGAELSAVAKHRRTEPAKLRGFCRGELDWIVMKALEKDRTRRYDTAKGFANDVRRYLNHEPVEAAAPRLGYRSRKFIARHRKAVATVSLVTMALVAGTVVSVWQAVRATQASQRERQARQQAVIAQLDEAKLRDEAERRAYASDMNLAAKSAAEQGSLGGLANLLAPWRDRQPDRRGWEWYYLNGLLHHDSMTLVHGTNGLLCVVWSPDGRKVAASGYTDSAAVWDAESGRELIRLRGHRGRVRIVAWDPSGNRVATAGANDSRIVIGDAESGEQLAALRGDSSQINCLAWRPDGQQIASGNKAGTVRLWDVTSGDTVQSLQTGDSVLSVAWHPNGRWLAVAGWNSDVRVWDTSLGRELSYETVSDTNGFLAALDWSPDGRWLAAGGSEWVVRLWSTATGENTMTFGEQIRGVNALKWSPDGQQMATASRDGVIKIWDPLRGECLNTIRGHLLGVTSLAWHRGGKRIASASLDGTVKLWDLNRVDPSLRVFSQEGQIVSVAWQPEGRVLAAASSGGGIRLWNAQGNKGVKRLGNHGFWGWRVAWDPTGTYLASAGGDGVVKLWETATGMEVWSAQVFSNAVRAIAWNPAGTELAATGPDSPMKILDTAGRTIRSFRIRGGPLALAWSPDGRYLVTDVQTLDATTGAQVRFKRLHQQLEVRDFAWSPDGWRLASCADDGQAKIWDSKSGAELHTLSGHTRAVYGVAWSPDGTRLATGSWDQTLKIWDPDSGQLLCSLEQPGAEITSVAWSSNGHQLAAGDLAGKIYIYDARPGGAAEPR